MPQQSSPTGVIGDPRTDPRVQAGWAAEQLVAADPPVAWGFKSEQERRQFPIYNQDGSSACVCFAKAKQVSIELFRQTGVWIDISPASIYQLRSNAPNPGTGVGDANDIINKRGATLEALMKSQNLTEAQIMAVRRSKVADMFALAIAEAVVSYFYFQGVDVEKIAQTIAKGYAVSLLLFGQFDEYTAEPTVLHPDLDYMSSQVQIRHEVVAVDFYLHPTLGKSLWIEDSWGVGNGLGGRRTFGQDWLSKRVIFADAIAILDFDGGGTKPRFDGSVISLQKCLRYEGFFPAEVAYVETYGPITRAGVVKFQQKYGIQPAAGAFGPATRAKLYQLYP